MSKFVMFVTVLIKCTRFSALTFDGRVCKSLLGARMKHVLRSSRESRDAKYTKKTDNMKTGEPKIRSDRPFSLPPGEFRPKQSLGQNFLSDQNYVKKIVNSFSDESDGGCRVIELGPGAGALSRVLFPRYPKMTGIEIDQRAVAFLQEKLPGIKLIHKDVLELDWPAMAVERGGPLSVIGNLPYYITSQIMFSMADSHRAVRRAVVTMQWEVAERVVATPNTKSYGILSVVFQLYAKPSLNFKIPPTVFFPQPKVDSALVTLDFTQPHPLLASVEPLHLRRQGRNPVGVLLAAFQKRRKMLRQSLKDLVAKEGVQLPEKWETMRPEQLKPEDFIRLTSDLFGKKESTSEGTAAVDGGSRAREYYASDIVWRRPLQDQVNNSAGDGDEDREEDA